MESAVASDRISRFLRDAQSFVPIVRPAKFACYNFLSYRFGLHVEPEFRLLSRLGGAGEAIDIGGNWGQSIHALKRYARPRRIVSFEPNPALAGHLRAVAGRLADVRIETVALGAEPGRFQLFVPRYRNYVYDGLASLDENSAVEWLNPQRLWRFDPARLGVERHDVEVRTLDSFGFRPDIVKIDVQGTEEAVARGGAETFGRHQPITIVEAPDAAVVAVFAQYGMFPYGLRGGELVRDDTSGINTMFLSDARLRALRG